MGEKFKFKSLRKTTIIILGVLLTVLIIAIYALTSRIMMGSIEKIESEDVIKHLDTVTKEINNDISLMSSVAQDWGAWDDTYAFAEDANETYVENNLSEDAFANLKMNLIIFTNDSGEYVFAEKLDLESTKFEPVSSNLKEALGKSGVFSNTDPDFKLNGIFMLPEGPMMIVSQPILTNDLKGPVHGNLIFGRFLNNNQVSELSERLNMKISMTSVGQGNQGNVKQSAATSSENSVVINVISDNWISGKTILKDIYGQPAVALSVEIPRDISQFGKTSVTYLLCVLVIVVLVFSVVILVFLEKNILSRLMKLSRDVLSIGEKGKNNKRLAHNNQKDEIYILAAGINEMLDKIEDSEKQVRQSEEKYRTFVEKGTEIIYSLDSEGAVSYISPNCFDILGYSYEDLIGRPFSFIMYQDDVVKWNEIFNDVKEFKAHNDGYELRSVMKGGPIKWLKTKLSPVEGIQNQDASYIGILNDVNKRKLAELALKKAHDDLETKVQERTEELSKTNDLLKNEIAEKEIIQEKITHIAYHDYLTGLPNRQHFNEHVDQAISAARRAEKPFGIIFLDMDDFKMVNDTMGHEQGDELLKEVAERISGILRKEDMVARFGGDEFIILAQNLKDVENINVVVEKIIYCLSQPFKLKKQDFYLTASVGVAMFPLDGENVETLLKNADIAMYKAKEKGKNQYALCNPLMKDKVTEVMKMTNHLYRALELDELVVYYQPQVCCSTGRITGFEALLRWRHPEMGLVSPGKFIPIAENTGLIVPIGEWVLRTACMQNKKWHNEGYPHLRMAVNLSLVQMKRGNISNDVQRILTETGLEPEFLELEITESTAMNKDVHIVEVLNEIKKLGITISIDDFGTEHSSLNRLKEMPIDRIKIAMPFVHGITISDKDEAITKTIITLAQSLGVSTIAEGVETKQQLEFLQKRMCDEIQGFFFYKPLPAEEIDVLLRSKCAGDTIK